MRHGLPRQNAARLLRAAYSASVAVAPGSAQCIIHPPPDNKPVYLSDLDRKIKNLRNVSLNIISTAAQADGSSDLQVTYSEQNLHAFYEDVVNSGLQEPSDRSITASPTDERIDRDIEAHLANSIHFDPSVPHDHHSVFHTFPTAALDALHKYEAAGYVVPIKSYTRVISALLHVPTSPSSNPRLGASAAYAQAWDLFSHMRYVAHPTPDARLYAVMIRACASTSGTRAEPERALDLWTEMLENRIEPTRAAYEAIILVCGRAGREWLGESIRFAKEMRARYRMSLPSSMASERRMWYALLEGCKRVGDLNRTRWILAEALRVGSEPEPGDGSVVDAKMMTHIFHTYASYQPPFSRSATRLVDDSSPAHGESSLRSPVETRDAHHTHAPSFARLPPQTASDVVAEVEFLFKRITRDTTALPEQFQEDHDLLSGKFANVELTPPLLNAYMSVHYTHASIERAREVFTSLFGTPLPSNAHTSLEALERCSLASKEERPVARQWAQELWVQWEAVEAKGIATGYEDVGTFARLIERAHTAMRRVLVLAGDVDGALALLRKFVNRYPPSTLIRPRSSPSSDMPSVSVPAPQTSPTIALFAKPPILSTRVTLTNPKSSDTATAKPLVRLTSAVGPRDDRVPPIIGFSDVELLHHRLVALKRFDAVGYVKWVCEAYRGTLRKRKEAVLRGASVSATAVVGSLGVE